MKLAILGTGNIIEDALTAISEVPEIEKTAILARPNSVAKGENFAKRFGIKKVYTDYGELLKDNEIDCFSACYISFIKPAASIII